MNKKSGFLLGLILVSLSSGAAQNQRYDLLDTIADNAFFSDSKVNFVARNYWKYLKEDESDNKRVHSAWGQSFAINYQSGYLFDFIGFDATFTGAIKLAASENFASRGILYRNSNNEAEGFSKIGQRYVKIKLGQDDGFNVKAKAGWQILKNFGTLTASNRLSENSYLGYSADFHYQDLKLDVAYVTSSINRDSPDKVHFTTNDGKTVDYIATTGLTYKNKDFSFNYAYGEADNYLRRHFIESSYKAMPNLTIGVQLYGSYALDEYKNMPISRKAFDDSAWHYASDIKWQSNDWSLKFGLAYTKANKTGGLGYYDRHMTKNSRGRFSSLTAAGADYMRDGELALTALGTYNFIDDVTTGLQLNYGRFKYENNSIWTGEVNIINHWKPSDPRLKKLSVFTMFGFGRSYKNNNKTPILQNGRAQSSPNLSGEVIIEYRFDLL